MSTSVALRDKTKEIVDTIDKPEFQRQLREALPEGLSVDRFTRVTKLALQLNPEIVTTDRMSLFRAMVRCAQDGLLPDGREAALVKVKVKGKDTCSYWPMVGGLRKKAAEHGFAIEAFPVYSNDHFDYELGFEPNVEHKPPPLDQDRGTLIGAYAVATRVEDSRKFLDVMGKGEIEAVRATSRAFQAGFGPWLDWPAEMYRKTVARRLFKQLPLAQVDERTERVVASDAELDEATSAVPELAGLPLVEDAGEAEVVEE